MKNKLAGFAAIAAVALISFNVNAAGFEGKKVLFIDSYHSGYAWSDGITEGVKSVIDESGAELKIHHMDTKRNGSEEFKKSAALEAKALIEDYNPDIVIATDDNASKYLIAPYFKDAALPFVFAGVNWDASSYGFPFKNVTGMVEVNSVSELLEVLKPMAKGDRIGFLTSDVTTEHKDGKNIKKVFGLSFAEETYVKTFAEWKTSFSDMQDKVDILLVSNNAGINDWNDAEATAFVEATTQIPTGTTYDWMAPYSLISYAKVAQEQGAWAAESALKILGGDAPSSIAIAKNKEGKLIINARIAEKMNANISADLVESADSVIE